MAGTGRANCEDLGKLLLRLTVGILMLFHGVSKIVGDVGFILGMVGKSGLPPELGYLVYVGEVIAPILVILGLWSRLAALVVAMNMVVAIWLVHMDHILDINNSGGWALELQAFYLFGAVAVVLLGAGRFSVGGAQGRWN